jgi:hypothetical protein
MSKGRLLISADDFGMTAGVNRGIVGALERGDITSTAIIFGHPGTVEALQLAASLPVRDLGLHVNLTDGRPVSHDPRLRSLLGADGRFRGRRWLTYLAARGELDHDGVRAEVVAQLGVCLDRGLTLTHADSHHYLHALPGIGEVIASCVADAGIPLVRTTGWRCLASPLARAAVGRSSSGSLDPDGVPRPASDAVIALSTPPTGPFPIRVVRRLLDTVGSGVAELVAHPGYADADLAACSKYVHGRQLELELLASPDFKQAIEDSGLRVTTFAALARGGLED